MTAPSFKETSENPFNELSELRFELSSLDEEKFDVKCRLRFSVMHHEHNGREYIVGLTSASLRLNLEGCKTTLDPVFGESSLTSVTDETTLEITSQIDAKAKAETGTGCPPTASAGIGAGMGVKNGRTSNLRKTRLPVTAKPNETWTVAVQTVDGTAQANLDGTAIAGDRLCTIKRSDGGNRLVVTGDIQASKGALSVSAKGGNRWGKDFALWSNKDAIVGQILKKALGRETVCASSSIIVASRCEVAEE